MDAEPLMTVRIIFQPPYRQNLDRSSKRHSRALTDVPKSIADQMVEDFRSYAKEPTEPTQRKLYTYLSSNGESDDPETIVALDFDEILELEATPVT